MHDKDFKWPAGADMGRGGRFQNSSSIALNERDPGAKQEKYLSLKMLLAKSGCFCSVINQSCIRPCTWRIVLSNL